MKSCPSILYEVNKLSTRSIIQLSLLVLKLHTDCRGTLVGNSTLIYCILTSLRNSILAPCSMSDDTSDTDPLSQAMKSFIDKDTYQVSIISNVLVY